MADKDELRPHLDVLRDEGVSKKDKAIVGIDEVIESPLMRGSALRSARDFNQGVGKIPGAKTVAAKVVGGVSGTGRAGEAATHVTLKGDEILDKKSQEIRSRPKLSEVREARPSHEVDIEHGPDGLSL